MEINENTRISNIINLNEDAIEVIAKINNNFLKLKNPLLRKLLAPRVTVKQAAKIGQTRPDIILKALREIGFTWNEISKASVIDSPTDYKQKINMELTNKIVFDVRPILESGVDPFKSIMEKINKLNPNEGLLIINSFEPIPLLNILKDKGFLYQTSRPYEGEVHTLLYHGNEILKNDFTNHSNHTESFETVETKYTGKMVEVDVRDLEMPMPMVTILEKLEEVSEDKALFVHHKKLPQYLIPELQNRGYAYVAREDGNNNVKLIIYKP